jgi:hypothetical protein
MLTFENRPIVPDVPYRTVSDDLTHANRGWLEKAEAALFEPAGGSSTLASSHAAAGSAAASAPGADRTLGASSSGGVAIP